MRKSLLLLLVAVLMPFFASAQNKAISKNYGSYSAYGSNSTEKITYVPYTALGWEQDVTPSTGANFSIGMWFKTTGVYASNHPKAAILMRLGTGNHNNNNGAIQLMQRNTGEITMNLGGDNTGGTSSTAGTSWSHSSNGTTGVVCGTASLNAWHYILVVFDSSNHSFRAYLDGEETANRDDAPVFGYKWGDGIFAFCGMSHSGSLDEIQFYNKALSADEATLAYNNAASSISGLTALFDFNEVKAGTTGTFAATAGSEAANTEATFEQCTFPNYWESGLVNRSSHTQTAPDLVDGRTIIASDCQVNIEATEGGSLTLTEGANSFTVGAGQTLRTQTAYTVNATPEAGYQLVKIEVISGANTTTVENGGTVIFTADATVKATFTNTLYTLTVANNDLTYAIRKGNAAVTDLTALLPETEYTLDVTVPEAKKNLVVTLGDATLTEAAGSTETTKHFNFTLTGDATLTLTAEDKAQYTINIVQPEGGTVTVSRGTSVDMAITNGAQVYEGTILFLSNQADAGYLFVTYTKDGANFAGTQFTVDANATISAVFEEGIDYCEPTPRSGRSNGTNTQYGQRGINSIEITDGTNTMTINGRGTTGTRAVYYDQTAKRFETEPGATINFSTTGKGEWMHTIVYFDANLNGFQQADKVYQSPTCTSSGEVYTREFSFTLPNDLRSGTYRVRYMVDWDVNDPCLYGQSGKDNGEAIIDFNIVIPSHELENERTVTVTSANETMGTVAITNPATAEKTITTNSARVVVKATPAAGYGFVNWTNAAGEVVSIAATYTYEGETDIELTANFGYIVNIAATTGGSISASVNGSAVASGSAVIPGAELVLNATPATGWRLISMTVNGTPVENPYTVEVNEAINVAATFSDAPGVVNINITGEGTVAVGSDYDEATATVRGTIWTNGSPIAEGSSPYIIFTPAEDYTLQSAVIDGDSMEDGAISYPDQADDYFWQDDEESEIWLYGCAGTTADLNITAVFASSDDAIEGIEIDGETGPVEYYNLQGVKVSAENLTPGIYIARQGSKTIKVLLK